jgi:predicted dehydrogenase/sugar phosphate isomerase/epimerase
MSANFVAREVGYDMREGWLQGDTATQAHFRPIQTFRQRFGELLDEIVAIGFSRIDLWTAHLHWEWATLAHIEIARDCLQQRRLTVASYAGHFGDTETEFEAACLLCRQLDIPILGGMSGLLESNPAAMIQLLRQNGLVFGLENHAEQDADELLAKTGQAAPDVLGLTVDTGWLATQGAPVLETVKKIFPRLKHVHLKDVCAPAGVQSGYPFKDMGHETCAFGKGVVPIPQVIEYLVQAGYRAGISIEHEPEVGPPDAACCQSHTFVTECLSAARASAAPPNPVKVAIVGCGNIADAYARQINSYPHVELLGAFDIAPDRANQLVERFGGTVYASMEAVLADPNIEIVVNLSIHLVHAEIIESCLRAGKHVHTEKPLALDSQTAWKLVQLAEERNLRLSSAPTTWLGEAQTSAWRRIREGEIGEPRVVYAEVNWGRIESWHPNPAPFYAVGPVFDVAVYPLTLLTAWFGPVTEVIADGGILYPERTTKDGTPFTVTSPDWVACVVRFAEGPVVRLTTSFYVGPGTRQAGLEIHGDNGTIRLDRWDVFNSPIYLLNGETQRKEWRIAPDEFPAEGIEFARGLSDLAHAIREHRPHLTTGAHAAHIVEVMECILESAKTGSRCSVKAPDKLHLPASPPS